MTLPERPSQHLAYAEYAQPFQPLGLPPPPYDDSRPWNAPAPIHPTGPIPLQPGQQVPYGMGGPQTGLHRIQSLSIFNVGYACNTQSQHIRPGKSRPRRSTHTCRKQSRHNLQQSYSVPTTVSFPEPQTYPANLGSPPPPYPGSPQADVSGDPPVSTGSVVTSRPAKASALFSGAAPTQSVGMSGDEISIQPEQCTFLVDAVKEMDLCSRIFSTWVEQIDRLDLGKKDKVEANIVSMITGLADDSIQMLTASRNILASYRALARLMDHRLSKIASSNRGGDLFSPSLTPSQAQAHDDFQTLAVDVHVHSAEISACVEKMQDRLHGLHDTVLRTHEKYSFRKKFWGWVVRVFRFIAQGLFLSGAVTALAHPAGIIGTAAMHVGSGLATIIASVCEKIKESYDDEEKGLNEVLRLLQGKIPKSMRVAQTALEKFQAAHIVFRQHHRVSSGRTSGYISPGEAAKARGKWHKAANLLELKDKDTLHLNIDTMAW